MISHKYQCIFIHIPKTGGTSIKDALGSSTRGWQGHKTASDSKDLYEEFWDSYFKFAVVRNPWDRACSIYHYYKYNKDERTNKSIDVVYTFKEFIVALCGPEQPKWLADFAHKTYGDQYEWTVKNGKVALDFVAKFERLSEDFDEICKRINAPNLALPHLRQSPHENYRKYYDNHSKQLLKERFTKDITIYEYEF